MSLDLLVEPALPTSAARAATDSLLRRLQLAGAPLAFALLQLVASSPAMAQCPVNQEGGFAGASNCWTRCSDGLDNDGDGLVDLSDSSCHEALCQDTLVDGVTPIDNDGDGLANGADPDCQCFADTYPSPGCTANDVRVVLAGLGLQGDGCVNQSDRMRLAMRVQLSNTATSRYDPGLYIALDGGDALNAPANTTGLCARVGLRRPGPVTGDCDANPFSTSPVCSVLDGDGFYRDLESGGNADRCADISNEAWDGAFAANGDPVPGGLADAIFDIVAPPAIDNSGQGDRIFYDLACSDIANPLTGFNAVSTCSLWENQAGNACNNYWQTVPGTSSKCICERTRTDVPVPNLALTCGAPSPAPALQVNSANPADRSITFSPVVTNSLSCTNPTPTPAERFQCGTVGFVRVRVDYDGTRGDITLITPYGQAGFAPALNTPYDDGNGGWIVDTGEELVWAPRNQSPGSLLGVLSPNVSNRTFSYTFTLTQGGPTTPIAFPTVVDWRDDAITTATNFVGNLDDALIEPGWSIGPAGWVEQDVTLCGGTPFTTPVTLGSFQAGRQNGGLALSWTTATEVGNAGFHVYLGGREAKHRVTSTMVASRGDSFEPSEYELFLPGANAKSVYLEMIDLDGGSAVHGPFTVGKRAGRVAAPDRIDWDRVRRETAAQKPRLAAAATKTASSAQVEFLVDRDGLYRVTYEQLLAAGLDLRGSSPGRLKLTNRDRLVPLRVVSKGKLAPGDYLEFVGEALDTLYTDTNVYRLGATGGGLAIADDSRVAAGALAPSYFETLTVERNLAYQNGSPTGDPWYDTWMTPGTRTWTFQVDALEPGPSQLRVVLGGLTNYAVEPDHHVQAKVNGVAVGEISFDGRQAVHLDAEIPTGVLGEGTNTLTLAMPGDTGAPQDIVLLERFHVTYPRRFQARAGALDFVAAGERIEVTGLSGPDAVAYRVDGTAVTRLAGASVRAEGGDFVLSLPGTGAPARYLVAASDGLLPATVRAGRQPSDLLAGPADYLVLSHASFAGSLAPFVSARTADGLSVKVVDVEDVYAQYSGSVFDADALRAYVADAASALGVRYVLLVGGDTYDYRNYSGVNSISFVPSLYARTSGLISFAPADSLLGDVDGDGVPDIPVGRWPVRTLDELDAVMAKTLDYAAKSYERSVVLAADAVDSTTGTSFAGASEAFLAGLGPDWQAERAYIDLHGVAGAKTRLRDQINQGVALVTYIGHSGPSNWSFSSLFLSSDVTSLTNGGSPTLVVQWGCWNTFYVLPTSNTMAHRFLLSDDRGAAAVLGASALLDTASAEALSGFLAPELGAPGARLGDALVRAKRSLALDHAEMLDALIGYSLLGDPALPVQR